MKKTLERILKNKNTSRMVALVLSLLLCISIIGIIASAATVTKDDLEVTLVTDKEEYSISEPIIATLTVENKSDKTIDEANLETLIPDGYHIESAATATKNVEQIRIGEKAALAVTLLPNSSTTSETPVTPGTVTSETPPDDGKASSNSGNNKQNDRESDNSKSSSTSSTSRIISNNSSSSSTRTTIRNNVTTATGRSAYPNNVTPNKVVKSVDTGDESLLMTWMALALFSLIGLIVIKKTNKGQNHLRIFISIVVSFAIILSSLSAFSLTVNAKTISSDTIQVEKTIVCNNNRLTIKSIVSFTLNDDDVLKTDLLTYSKPLENHMTIDEDTGTPYVDNEIIVTGKNIDSTLFLETLKGYGGQIVGEIPSYGVFQVRFPQKKSIAEMETIFRELDEKVSIENATPNYIYPIDESYYPNDPVWEEWQYTPAGNNWGWEYIFAPQAWDYKSHAKNIIDVGIIDSGFSTDHPDLSFAEEPIANSGATLQHKWTSHGTHVAGTIGSKFDNGIGVSGVSTNCRMHGFSLWGACAYGKTDLLALKIAFFYLIVEQKCRVVNISMGMDLLSFNADRELKEDSGTTPALNELRTLNKELESDFLKYLKDGYDFLVCKAGGNQEGEGYKYFKKIANHPVLDKEGNEAPYSYYSYSDLEDYIEHGIGSEPEQSSFDYSKYASRLLHGTYVDIETEYGNVSPDNDILSGITNEQVLEHIICVGALELDSNTVKVAPYSQEGERIDVLAPGSKIYSTVKIEGINTYDYMDGTSMASPMVAGVASLMLSIDPSLKGNQIKHLIVSSGRGARGKYKTKAIDAEVTIQNVLMNKYGYIPERDSHGSPGDISGIDDPEPSNPSEPTVPGDVGFASGKGTKEDPYVIMTPEQLNSVRYHLDANFAIGADIDLSGYGSWLPIGSYTKPFVGTLDGRGYAIKGLRLDFHSFQYMYDNATDKDYYIGVGLFGAISRDLSEENAPLVSGVNNITLEDVDVNFDSNNCPSTYREKIENDNFSYQIVLGLICGLADTLPYSSGLSWYDIEKTYVSFKTCRSSAKYDIDLTSMPDGFQVLIGGIVGDSLGGEYGGNFGIYTVRIENCSHHAFGKIATGIDCCFGGIIATGCALCSNSVASGSIFLKANSVVAGGIASYANGMIKKCKNEMSITVENYPHYYLGTLVTSQFYLGGIVGVFSYNGYVGTVEDCTNLSNGNIIVKSTVDVNDTAIAATGGIIGYYRAAEFAHATEVSGCYNYCDELMSFLNGIDNIGRICGDGDYGGVLDNNYSSSKTLLNNQIASNNIGAQYKNGANL